jgi:hypothetical protein
MKYCFILIACLFMSCSQRVVSNYWFKGDIYCTAAHVYQRSILSFPTDSTFVWSWLPAFSRRERAQEKYFEVNCFSGTVRAVGDTLRCEVNESTEGVGQTCLFYKRRQKIFLLDFDKHLLQKYRRYRGKKRYSGYRFSSLYYTNGIQCCKIDE